MRNRLGVLALVSAVVVGCSTVRTAREVQRALDPKGDEAAPAQLGALDLSGRSLRELVDFAMTNRPSVVRAALAVRDARLALREIAADAPVLSATPWAAPRLSLSAGYSESNPGTHLDGHGWSGDGSPNAALSLDLLLWDFGRNDARALAQAERVVAAEYDLISAGYAVFEEVSAAYFNAMESFALLEVAFTNEQEYAEHLVQAEKLLAAGEAKQLDVQRARLDLARAREMTVNASNSVANAGAEFVRALGIDASKGSWRRIYDWPDHGLAFAVRGFADTRFDEFSAFQLARTNAPSMRLERAGLRSASASVDYAVADLMPSFSTSASLSWTDPLWFWRWGVSGAQSLFLGFRKTTAVDRAVVALQQAAESVDQAEHELSLRISLAVAARDNAVEARRTAGESLRQARENLRLVGEQYKLGEVDRIDYTDSVADYVEALGNRVSAFYKGQRAEAALFALLGIYPVYDERKLMEESK